MRLQLALWLIFGSVGFVLALLYGIDNVRDLPAVENDPTQKGYAIGRVVFSIVVLIVEAVFVGIGVVGLVAPRDFRSLLTWSLVAVPGLMMLAIGFLLINKVRLRRRVSEQ